MRAGCELPREGWSGRRGFVAVGEMLRSGVWPWIHDYMLGGKEGGKEGDR